MKTSELIEILQKNLENFGDLPVIIDDLDYGASHLTQLGLVQVVDSVDYLRPELTPVGLAVCLLKPE